MSALGQKPTFAVEKARSALPAEADIRGTQSNVRMLICAVRPVGKRVQAFSGTTGGKANVDFDGLWPVWHRTGNRYSRSIHLRVRRVRQARSQGRGGALAGDLGLLSLLLIACAMRTNPRYVTRAVQGDPNLGVAMNTPDDK